MKNRLAFENDFVFLLFLIFVKFFQPVCEYYCKFVNAKYKEYIKILFHNVDKVGKEGKSGLEYPVH